MRRLAEILKDCERRVVCLHAKNGGLEARGKLPAGLRKSFGGTNLTYFTI